MCKKTKKKTLQKLMEQWEPAVISRLSHPVEVAGVPVLAFRRQVLAQAGSLPDHQERDGHEERQQIIRLQEPFVDLR